MQTASEKEFSLARADCELQDTATFPPSTAFISIRTCEQKIKCWMKITAKKIEFHC